METLPPAPSGLMESVSIQFSLGNCYCISPEGVPTRAGNDGKSAGGLLASSGMPGVWVHGRNTYKVSESMEEMHVQVG